MAFIIGFIRGFPSGIWPSLGSLAFEPRVSARALIVGGPRLASRAHDRTKPPTHRRPLSGDDNLLRRGDVNRGVISGAQQLECLDEIAGRSPQGEASTNAFLSTGLGLRRCLGAVDFVRARTVRHRPQGRPHVRSKFTMAFLICESTYLIGPIPNSSEFSVRCVRSLTAKYAGLFKLNDMA
jgi:hypothetical protein